MTAEFTAEQIEAGIAEAIRRGDIDEVPGLIRLLMTVDARRAAAVYDTILLGVDVARTLRP